MNIEVGRKKYYLHKRYTEFLMLHQVRPSVRPCGLLNNGRA